MCLFQSQGKCKKLRISLDLLQDVILIIGFHVKFRIIIRAVHRGKIIVGFITFRVCDIFNGWSSRHHGFFRGKFR